MPVINKRQYKENINSINKSENEIDPNFEELLDYNSGSLDTMLKQGKLSSSRTFDSVTS